MGMSIDDARRELISGKPYTDKFAMALVVAIDTMRKYQKIEEEYKKYLNNMVTNIYADGKFIKALIEVLEDGKTD